MKPIFHLIFLTFILAACGAPAPTPTATLAPTLTPSATATPEPTQTPTKEPEPTATPDKLHDFSTDVGNPEGLPQATVEYLMSAEYANLVMEREAAGIYPEFSPDVVPFPGIVLVDPSSRMLNELGYTSMFRYKLTEEELKKYLDPKVRPLKMVEAYQVTVDGQTNYFMLMRVKNSNNTYGFFGIVFTPLSKDRVGPKLEVTFKRGDPAFLSTIEYFKKDDIHTGCQNYYLKSGLNSGLCGILPEGQIPEPIKNWAKTGNLNNQTQNGFEIPINARASYYIAP